MIFSRCVVHLTLTKGINSERALREILEEESLIHKPDMRELVKKATQMAPASIIVGEVVRTPFMRVHLEEVLARAQASAYDADLIKARTPDFKAPDFKVLLTAGASGTRISSMSMLLADAYSLTGVKTIYISLTKDRNLRVHISPLSMDDVSKKDFELMETTMTHHSRADTTFLSLKPSDKLSPEEDREIYEKLIEEAKSLYDLVIIEGFDNFSHVNDDLFVEKADKILFLDHHYSIDGITPANYADLEASVKAKVQLFAEVKSSSNISWHKISSPELHLVRLGLVLEDTQQKSLNDFLEASLKLNDDIVQIHDLRTVLNEASSEKSESKVATEVKINEVPKFYSKNVSEGFGNIRSGKREKISSVMESHVREMHGSTAPSWNDLKKMLEASNISKSFEDYSKASIKTDTAHGKVILTVGMGGSGKTTTALNLAEAFSISGKKTLLIDGDLRDGQLRLLTGGESSLVELKAAYNRSETAKSYLEKLEPMVSGVTVITSPRRPRSGDLFSQEDFEELIAAARIMFEIIVIDGAGNMFDPLLDFFMAEAQVILGLIHSPLDYARLNSYVEAFTPELKAKVRIVLNKLTDSDPTNHKLIELSEAFALLPTDKRLYSWPRVELFSHATDYTYCVHLLRSKLEQEWLRVDESSFDFDELEDF